MKISDVVKDISITQDCCGSVYYTLEIESIYGVRYEFSLTHKQVKELKGEI